MQKPPNVESWITSSRFLNDLLGRRGKYCDIILVHLIHTIYRILAIHFRWWWWSIIPPHQLPGTFSSMTSAGGRVTRHFGNNDLCATSSYCKKTDPLAENVPWPLGPFVVCFSEAAEIFLIKCQRSPSSRRPWSNKKSQQWNTRRQPPSWQTTIKP